MDFMGTDCDESTLDIPRFDTVGKPSISKDGVAMETDGTNTHGNKWLCKMTKFIHRFYLIF